MSIILLVLLIAFIVVILFINCNNKFSGTYHESFHVNLEIDSISNQDYRKVIYTDPKQQLVLMSLNVGEDIPAEIHDGTQLYRIEKGNGSATVWDKEKSSIPLTKGVGLIVPAGTCHYIKNNSLTEPLKLYTIYSPPQHKPGTVHNRQHDDPSI
tara:strand:- start:952 stop:1413 length:462 start_codon:yes stop_codon:yes gene_type:complete